jgi:hypothetical protein
MVHLSWGTNTITIDAAATETHGGKVNITDHPVEKGAPPTDHVRPLPRTLKVDGVIVDWPLASAGAKTDIALGKDPMGAGDGRAAYLVELLHRLRDSATIFTVDTGVRSYSSMLIEEISVPRDKSTASGLRVQLQLKEVRFVDSQEVPLQKPKTDAGKKKTNAGKKNPESATAAEESWLVQGLKGLANLSR